MSDLAGAAADGGGLQPIWTPDPGRVADAAITRFARQASQRSGRGYPDYAGLWAWSVEHLDQFWATVWDFFDIAADGTPDTAVKRLIQGRPLDQVAAPDAVDDYAALTQFTAYAGGPGRTVADRER